jgi:hypothetical protein
MSCTCIQVNVTPASTGIAETIQVNGVLVSGSYTYTFTTAGQEYIILWDGEQWSLFAIVAGPDIFIGSNSNVDCPTGEWTLDPDIGPSYFDAFGTVDCPAPEPTPQEAATTCYNLLVWKKQCEFGKEVAKYLKLLQFGVTCCNELEELKNKRRALLILNCYDTRDIPNNTTEYNTLTYSQIKELLEY